MALETLDRAKIRVQDLSFFYGKKQVLANNDLEIAEKRVNAIIGPSGCGKSTHIRTYNRMFDLYPGQRATGRVMLDDIDVLRPNIHRRIRATQSSGHGASATHALSDVHLGQRGVRSKACRFRPAGD